jgi:ABC-type phosphate transport system permease subunit
VSNPAPTQPSQDLHNRGWGFALLIILIALAANVTAVVIHNKTYLAPPATSAASGAER